MNGISKFGLTALACAGLLSVSATMAEAKGFSAGHFRFLEGSSNVTICLRANGTAVSTSIAGYTGRWVNRTLNGTATGFLWMNNASGSENTSIIALGVANSKVTNWLDSGNTLSVALNAVRITKISNACPLLAPNARQHLGGLFR